MPSWEDETMSRFHALALACALVAAASPAVAGSSASASFSQIKFQLVDLDPDDGQAPSFSFLDGENFTSVSGWAGDASGAGSFTPIGQSAPGWLQPLSGTAASGGLGSNANWSADASAVSLTGSAQSASGYYRLDVRSGTSSPAEYYLRNLQLSANSALKIEATYALDVSASGTAPCLSGFFCEKGWRSYDTMAGASVGLGLAYSYLDDGLSVGYSKLAGDSISAFSTPGAQAGAVFIDTETGDPTLILEDVPSLGQTKHAEGVLKLSFVNASQFAQKANLYASLSVWGQDNTPAVPEPAMPVLFACGALALAVRVRRQRSR
jgi:hypothetical protein